MGLYFLAAGAVRRPSEVLYDRAGSAFALASAQAYDWPQLLAGARLLHLSGITPAVGAAPAEAALAAARAARAIGATVSFDGNYRARLWEASGREPRAVLHALLAEADVAFADPHDIALVLGDTGGPAAADAEANFHAAASRAFVAFPNLKRIASTQRTRLAVGDQRLGALLATRDGALHVAPALALSGIVDRIGAGDAFAAGLLHGLLSGMGDADSLRFAHAAGCLKHAVPGDANLVDADDVHALMRGELLDVKR